MGAFMKHFLVIFFLFVHGIFLFAEDIPTVVIAPFKATEGVEQSEVDIIQSMFTSQYAATKKAKVVDRSKFNLIQEEMKFQSSDWSDNDKVAEFGRALNAVHVITGEFTKFPKGVYVNIQVLDVNSTMIIASITPILIVKETLDVIDKLPEICEKLATEAVGGVVKKPNSMDKTAQTDMTKTIAKKSEVSERKKEESIKKNITASKKEKLPKLESKPEVLYRQVRVDDGWGVGKTCLFWLVGGSAVAVGSGCTIVGLCLDGESDRNALLTAGPICLISGGVVMLCSLLIPNEYHYKKVQVSKSVDNNPFRNAGFFVAKTGISLSYTLHL